PIVEVLICDGEDLLVPKPSIGVDAGDAVPESLHPGDMLRCPWVYERRKHGIGQAHQMSQFKHGPVGDLRIDRAGGVLYANAMPIGVIPTADERSDTAGPPRTH
ncbi:MAG: hypothetical protein QOE66_1896, partial [Chloroflexota bacterium]|nr:hypothetical protein [Chloroflexota bacterium]